MSLWLDKHRPRTLEKLTIHDALTGRLHKIAESPQFPHLMFYGPAVRRASLDCLARVRRALVAQVTPARTMQGSGKRTRIVALLKQMYGPGVEKVRHRRGLLPPGGKGGGVCMSVCAGVVSAPM